MTDRELLEMAAKAAGYDVRWHENWQCFVHVGPHNITNPPTMAGRRMVWVPLTDDGDALRLAVKLKFWVQINHMNIEVELWQDESGETKVITEPTDPLCDYAWATRRAIVRAAAEMGKAKEAL